MSYYEEIEERWKVDQPLYEMLGTKVSAFLKNEILRHEVFPEVSHRTKELLSIIKKIQRKSKEKEYTYLDLKDKLGIRVICSFSSHLDTVDEIIKENFIIEKAEYKREELDFDRLDYTSNHYDLFIKPSKFLIEDVTDFKDLVFELQVRSIN